MEQHKPPEHAPRPTGPPPKPSDARRSVEPPWMRLLERGVEAVERLAQDPVIQFETMPPVCPHCERMNPVVAMKEDEGQGPMAEIVFRMTCLHCQTVFYAVPVQYECVKSVEDAADFMRERMETGGFNGGSSQTT